MTLVIRRARGTDLPACTKILVEEFGKQGEPFTNETGRARLEELLSNNPDLCFCLELEGKVIGFAFAERFKYAKGDYLWVSEFAINAQNQGKGFGLETLRFMEKLAKEKGFNSLYLAANIKERAFKIYEKFGFKKTGFFFMEKEL